MLQDLLKLTNFNFNKNSFINKLYYNNIRKYKKNKKIKIKQI